MKENQIQGKVSEISAIETNEYNGNVYEKVFITVDMTSFDSRTGEPYYNFPRIEFNGDKGIAQVMNVSVGDEVIISFQLRGTNYTHKTTGEQRNFTSVRGYKLEIVQKQQQNQQQAQEQSIYEVQTKPDRNGKVEMEDDPNLPF